MKNISQETLRQHMKSKEKSKILDILVWTFKLYSITLVIPFSLTIMNILFVGILGFESNFDFLMIFKIIWVDYYITGSFLDIMAFRWHLGLLFLSFFINLFNKTK